MPQTLDFESLLKDLFQEHPQPQKNGAEGNCEADNSPLQACNLYVFMREIIIEHFGMGYDYAFSDRSGTPLKSWFTIPEAIETAENLGYKLTIAEVRAYLDNLIKQKYIETDNYKYRRCAFWDKEMEKYLRHHSAG